MAFSALWQEQQQSHRAAGSGFLDEAKAQHDRLISALLEKADSFSSLETFTAALQAETWQLTEQLAKQSWRNGMARGREGRRSGRNRS